MDRRDMRGATEARITKKVALFIGMMVAMHSFPRRPAERSRLDHPRDSQT
jgi:hypothetical protein